MKEYYPRQSVDSKNTANLHLQVAASADRTSVYTSVPTLLPTSLDRRLLVSSYTISWYRDMRCYDMNPTCFALILAHITGSCLSHIYHCRGAAQCRAGNIWPMANFPAVSDVFQTVTMVQLQRVNSHMSSFSRRPLTSLQSDSQAASTIDQLHVGQTDKIGIIRYR